MLAQFTNNAGTTLAANIGPAALALTVNTGDGAKFPSPTGGQYFWLTLCKVISGIEYQWEVVKVTARAGDIMTILRAQDGTTAQSFVTGDPASLRMTAGQVAAFATQGDVETLTNKTLTTPVIAQINDANGNAAVKLPATASAVNQVTLGNAATGNAVQVQATGSDANISLNLVTKGTGVLLVNGAPMASGGGAGSSLFLYQNFGGL